MAPVNSGQIKIKLHSILRGGSSNDGVYDDLYLGTVPFLGLSANNYLKSNFVISPNPSTGIFKIQTENPIENANIIVTDLYGKIVYKTKAEIVEYRLLDLRGLQSGIYILNIVHDNSNYSQKIIKQ